MSRKIQELNLETLAFVDTKVKRNHIFRLLRIDDRRNLVLKMPKTKLPFGLQKDNLNNNYILDISMENQRETLEAFEKFADAIVNKVHLNFYSDKTIEEVKKMFTNFIKYPENDMFAPTITSKITVSEDNIPYCDFYSSEKNKEEKFPKIDVIEKGNEPYLLKAMGKGVYTETIMECIGLWVSNERFWVNFKVNQVIIYPQSEVLKETSNSDADFLD